MRRVFLLFLLEWDDGWTEVVNVGTEAHQTSGTIGAFAVPFRRPNGFSSCLRNKGTCIESSVVPSLVQSFCSFHFSELDLFKMNSAGRRKMRVNFFRLQTCATSFRSYWLVLPAHAAATIGELLFERSPDAESTPYHFIHVERDAWGQWEHGCPSASRQKCILSARRLLVRMYSPIGEVVLNHEPMEPDIPRFLQPRGPIFNSQVALNSSLLAALTS